MKTTFLSLVAAIIVGVLAIHHIEAKSIWEPDAPDLIGTIGLDVQHIRDEKRGVDCYAMQYGGLSPAISCVVNK